MPDVLIEDMTEGFKSGAPSLFSPTLQALLKETYQSGKQSILFLNRRAYSPFVMCRDCGHKLECETCAVSLAYHRAESLLRCHHCDRKMNVPNICPVCEGERMKPFGMGAERVHEEVQQLLPQAAIARLDRDIARKKGALEEILTRFRGGQTDVLVGTQMVAKGLDFPNVTLVGVIAADISLNIPDFRASERTFQLLSQVAGRAGRGDHHGRVVIQTFNPLHPAVLAAKDHDYEEFFEYEIEQRKLAAYPPFWRLVNILCTGKDRESVMRLSAAAAQKLRVEVTNGDVLGPAFCPIERIKGSWRRHIMIKLPLEADVEPIRGAVEGLKEKDARLAIDVDPYTLS
jgi:primosomal protein N' (replication factor Y)